MPTINLPTPPSANRYWRIFNNRAVRSSEADSFKRTAAMTAKMKGVRPAQGDFEVAICLRPKTTKKGEASKVRIDLDNCIKVLLDSLNGVAWLDDKQVVRIEAWIGSPVECGGVDVSFQRIAAFEVA